ncbi:MAG: alpha/beta hydrolase [Chloroflexi bacterium]|nr:alpha/beta hydrolase [Chloroflexota bacterium]
MAAITSNALYRDSYAECNGIRLHYLEWGWRDAPTLVLLHGLHGHAHVWDPLSEALSRNYHVVALDMRGHGDSQWSDEMSYRAEDYLADLGTFIGRLGSSPVTLAGESLGGLVAFAYAAVNPTRVDRLVVVDIGPDINGDAIRRMRDSANERPPDFADVADALRWVKGEGATRDDGDLRRIVEHNLTQDGGGRFRWKYDPATDGIISSGDTGDGAELLWRMWKAISAPTLLVRGASSDLLERASAAEMVRVGRDVRVVEIPDAGHTVLADNFLALQDAVCEFLLP